MSIAIPAMCELRVEESNTWMSLGSCSGSCKSGPAPIDLAHGPAGVLAGPFLIVVGMKRPELHANPAIKVPLLRHEAHPVMWIQKSHQDRPRRVNPFGQRRPGPANEQVARRRQVVRTLFPHLAPLGLRGYSDCGSPSRVPMKMK